MKDMNGVEHVSVEVSDDGAKLWVNVDGECVLRSYGHGELLIRDSRLSERLSSRYYAIRVGDVESEVPMSFLELVKECNLTGESMDRVALLQAGDTCVGKEADEVITRVK